ncbi:MAG: carboxymuconolactone decarboxylase family protein [bacterium]|nr:carboxymuconolactone decarboxylase family protein [bacterium]
MFDLVMPEGMEPLELFRVLARSERVFPRFMRAGVLDRGPIPIRDREIVIHRTTALCGAEYEWGVHVTAFWRPLGLGEDVLAATVNAQWDDPVFDDRQQSLVRMCDEFHRTNDLSDDAYRSLQQYYDERQILELIYTVGMYHAVSFLVRGLRLAPEPFGARFDQFAPTAGAEDSSGVG